MSEDDKKKRGSFIARVLDRSTVSKIAPWTWVLWRRTNKIYWGTGYRAGEKPPYSGDLLVQSPYTDWYNLTWGLAPNQDMPKWRWMYRSRPEIKGGVDKKIILAVGKGISVVCQEDDEIEGYVTKLLDVLNIRDTLQSAVHDMIVYGQAYFEKVRTTSGDKQEGEEVAQAPEESRMFASLKMNMRRQWMGSELDTNDPAAAAAALRDWVHDVSLIDDFLVKNADTMEADVYAPKSAKYVNLLARTMRKKTVLYQAALYLAGLSKKKLKRYKAITQRHDRSTETTQLREEEFQAPEGELVELKPIDPLWMRINRDAFGNVIGFVQWGLTPIPQAVVMEKLVYLRWMPKSWAYESAYGTSSLMPVQRHVSLLIQAEEDMKVAWHQYATPKLHFAVGTAEKPYPVPAISAFVNSVKNRTTTTDIVTPGDVTVKEIIPATSETAKTFEVWAKYLREKIYETLSIPDVLMNLPGEMTRATSDVTLQAFIAEEKMIQELVGEQLLKQVIEPEVRRHFAAKYPDGAVPSIKITWPPILEEDRNKKIDRLVKSVGVPFETVNEARTEASLAPIDDPKYDQLQDAPLKGLGNDPFSTSLAPSKNPEISESERTGDREESLQKRDAGNPSA